MDIIAKTLIETTKQTNILTKSAPTSFFFSYRVVKPHIIPIQFVLNVNLLLLYPHEN